MAVLLSFIDHAFVKHVRRLTRPSLCSQNLEKAGFAKLKTKPRVQNIVATADLGVKPDLEGIIETIHRLEGAKAIYEPE